MSGTGLSEYSEGAVVPEVNRARKGVVTTFKMQIVPGCSTDWLLSMVFYTCPKIQLFYH